MMDQRQLETFVRVAALGNFTRAAEELALSQPAVTRQVAALEKQCGTRLLDRLGHTVALTPAGEALHRYAVEILRLSAEAEEAVARIAVGEAGRLRVGASTTAATYFLPPFLAAFRSGFPGVELSVVTGGSEEVARMVVENAADVGVVMDFRGESELLEVPLAGYENVLAVHPEDELGANPSPAALASRPLLVTRRGTRLRRIVDSVFPSPVAMELDNLETIKKMVQARLGIALLPLLAMQEEIAAGTLVAVPLEIPVKEPQTISAIYRRDKYLTAAMRGFLGSLNSRGGSPQKRRDTEKSD